MRSIFVGSEAIARGEISRGQLRWKYRAIFPDVYQLGVAEPSLYARTVAAWLWSRERGVITGRAAAALHGAKWVEQTAPVELLWSNRHHPAGIITRNERFRYDEVVEIDGMAVAIPQRTAIDLGRFLGRTTAVAHLDDLSRATGLRWEHMQAPLDMHKGARHIRRCRDVLQLMDSGGQSPKESWLRLLLIDAGYPRPTTQIALHDRAGFAFAYVDMGWEDVRIAVEYDGDQHRRDRRQYVTDVRRLAKVRELDWLHVRVIAEDRPHEVLRRVRAAWAQREKEGMVVKESL